MEMSEERLANIEKRLAQVELLLQQQNTTALKSEQKITPPTIAARPVTVKLIPKPASSISITQLLGWAGVTAIVLAAVFLIRLALDGEWLTPWRQITIALVASFTMIGAGLRLRSVDQQYASFLPAAGVVVQFCAIYGAHIYYQLIGIHLAIILVVGVCFLTLWLGRKFNNEAYALFAVVGSYLAPLLLPGFSISVVDLAAYFSAWSVLYCAHSIWIGSRRPYVLAGYLAFLGFHYAANAFSRPDWTPVFAFQIAQFLIFVTATLLFSMHKKQAMSDREAIAHFPLMLIFYALQYLLLDAHIPKVAPWIAIASAAIILFVHGIARKSTTFKTGASNTLVATYVALVLYHAGYIELLPSTLTPWLALLILPICFVLLIVRKTDFSGSAPYKIVLAIIFGANYFRLMEGSSLDNVVAHNWLALFYGLELYAAYYLARKIAALADFAIFALYAGHIAVMVAAMQILNNPLEVSIVWSIIALVSLVASFTYRDKILGKSSLFILAISCGKVMLLDLSNSTPLVRIASLLVLGATLYAGGWLYKKVDVLNERIEK